MLMMKMLWLGGCWLGGGCCWGCYCWWRGGWWGHLVDPAWLRYSYHKVRIRKETEIGLLDIQMLVSWGSRLQSSSIKYDKRSPTNANCCCKWRDAQRSRNTIGLPLLRDSAYYVHIIGQNHVLMYSWSIHADFAGARIVAHARVYFVLILCYDSVVRSFLCKIQ